MHVVIGYVLCLVIAVFMKKLFYSIIALLCTVPIILWTECKKPSFNKLRVALILITHTDVYYFIFEIEAVQVQRMQIIIYVISRQI